MADEGLIEFDLNLKILIQHLIENNTNSKDE